jgi:hypothetical protein
VKDEYFEAYEQDLGYYHEQMVQLLSGGEFEEFHATDLLACKKPFDTITRDDAKVMMGNIVSVFGVSDTPIVYSGLDLGKHAETDFGGAKAADVNFRRCLRFIEEWFQEKDDSGLGLIIADDSDKATRADMQKAFLSLRKRVVSSPPVRGRLAHLHDDMYFGNSKYSIGLQVADTVALLIGRHLAGYSDTEDLFTSIKPSIYKCHFE